MRAFVEPTPEMVIANLKQQLEQRNREYMALNDKYGRLLTQPRPDNSEALAAIRGVADFFHVESQNTINDIEWEKTNFEDGSTGEAIYNCRLTLKQIAKARHLITQLRNYIEQGG